MKISNLKKLACITAIVLAPSIAFAGGTNATSEDKASTGQSKDPDPGLKGGDTGVTGVGQSSKQDTVIVDDATLATNVQNALKADPNIQNLDIKAEVSNGVVTLTGVASAKRWTSRATTVANSVKGVKSVKNNMTIGHK
jgi:osmotically-inducible protein OsmY